MRNTNIGQLVVGIASPTTSPVTGTTITDVTSSLRLTQIPLRFKFARVFPNNYMGVVREVVMSPRYEVTEFPNVIMDCRNGTSSI